MKATPPTIAAHADLAELSWAFRSDVGVLRDGNEDCVGAYAPFEPEDRGPLFVVADGMGGALAGEVASRLAVETVLGSWASGPPAPPRQALRAAVRAANAAVFAASLDAEQRGMGTTLTAIALSGREALIGHVGDSRAYLVRGGECSQLTTDHSRVAEMQRMRLITSEQAASHPSRSVLTRNLGHDPGVQVDLVKSDTAPGDRFVLCSDGLWDLVPCAEIAQVASEQPPDEAAATLLAQALERGAPDNVTVVVVEIKGALPEATAAQTKPWWAFLRGEA